MLLKLKPMHYLNVTKTESAARKDFETWNSAREHQMPADPWYKEIINRKQNATTVSPTTAEFSFLSTITKQ